MDYVLESVVRVLDAHGLVVPLVKDIIANQVEATAMEATLFRSNTIRTRLITSFAKVRMETRKGRGCFGEGGGHVVIVVLVAYSVGCWMRCLRSPQETLCSFLSFSLRLSVPLCFVTAQPNATQPNSTQSPLRPVEHCCSARARSTSRKSSSR